MRHILTAIGILILFISCSDKSKQEEIEGKIKEWIITNSIFPESYSPESFSEVEIVYYKDTVYRITHKYNLKDTSKETHLNEHFFVLKKDFKVALITDNRTSYTQSIPPSIYGWASKFGDKFINVDFAGCDSSLFFRVYKDYKNIHGDIYSYFDYLDTNCLSSLNSSFISYDSFRINRIIRATPNYKSELYKLKLNELGIDIDRTFENSPQLNFAVLKNQEGRDELYAFMKYDFESHRITFVGISYDTTFNWTLDSLYTNTNCFEHRLKFNKKNVP